MLCGPDERPDGGIYMIFRSVMTLGKKGSHSECSVDWIALHWRMDEI